MKTSAEELFKKQMLLFQNTQSLLQGFAKATTTNLSSIFVPLISIEDGVTVTQHEINSFSQVLAQLSRINNNFNALTNDENIAQIINADGSVGQVQKTTFGNGDYLENFRYGTDPISASTSDVGTRCLIDTESFIKRMVFPSVKLPVLINSKIKSEVNILLFTVTDGFGDIPDNVKLVELDYLISVGSVVASKETLTLKQEKENVTFFGKFTPSNLSVNGIVSKFTLNTVNYSGINFIAPSIELKVGDLLISKDGNSKHQITEINTFTKEVTTNMVAGNTNILEVVDGLLFNQNISTDRNVVGVPVAPQQKLVVFFATETKSIIGYPSDGVKLDTSTYTVSSNGRTYTIDEYYSTEVVNFTTYLESVIKESSIPISLGIQPQKVVLDSSNFVVTQLNTHLTNSKSIAEIEALNTTKQNIQNQLDFNKSLIDTTQNELDTGKFKSTAEKKFRIEKLQTLRDERAVLENNLLNVSRDVDLKSTNSGLKNQKPKYRILGSWGIQEDMYSPATRPQKIIKYDIKYRYLSKNLDTVDSTSSKLIVNGVEQTITYSSWNTMESRSLNKVPDSSGNLVWEIPILDSTDDININEASISINQGESVEIKVRAVSEAGFPTSTLFGEYSEILRVDFPTNIIDANIVTIIEKNDIDLKKAEFNNILKTSGILGHISGQIQEGDKLYYHKTDDISSGFFTSEQKIISLFNKLKMQDDKIAQLESIGAIKNVTIELTDFNNESFVVANNSTMVINAGNYNDSINLLDETKFGSIIRRTAFIKIRNTNSVPLDLKTIVPGSTLDSNNAKLYYNTPVYAENRLLQSSRSVLYFRNLDLTLQQNDTNLFNLVVPKDAPITNTVPVINIDANALANAKNVVQFDGTNVTRVKLLPNIQELKFIAFTSEHPLFDSNSPNSFLPNLQKGGRNLIPTNKLPNVQHESYSYGAHEEVFDGLGFGDNDFYAVGESSVGAFLYPKLPSKNLISVVGDNSASTLVLTAGSEISIPIVFEYRFTDRLGYINGVPANTIDDALTYTKKIGVDLLLNNQLFSFDLEVFSNLKSKVAPLDALNISSVVGAFKNEDPETLT